MQVIYQSPIGKIILKSSFGKLNELRFIDELECSMLKASKSCDSNTLLALKELDLYFNGRLKFFKCEFEILNASAFVMAIYQALLKVKYGQSTTYSALSQNAGYLHAQRACGNALNKNPLAIIIPCHRVLAKSSFGGYAQGLQRKKFLLELEKTYNKGKIL